MAHTIRMVEIVRMKFPSRRRFVVAAVYRDRIFAGAAARRGK
jgi:hypothetical protein